MTYIRIHWKQLGGHVHCRVFTSQNRGGTFAKNGDLVFDEREWPEVRSALTYIEVEFIEDES